VSGVEKTGGIALPDRTPPLYFATTYLLNT